MRPCVDARLSEQKIAVILSMSEGSRMVTLGVLFTGFFVAALLRMAEEDGGFCRAPFRPPLKGEVPRRGGGVCLPLEGEVAFAKQMTVGASRKPEPRWYPPQPLSATAPPNGEPFLRAAPTVLFWSGRRGGARPRPPVGAKNCCHPERSEGSRMVTLGVLFTGFFVAALLRMTEEDGDFCRAPFRPPLLRYR